MNKSSIILIILIILLNTTIISQTYTSGSKWKYSTIGYVKSLGLTDSGTTFILDSENFLYIINTKGEEVSVKRYFPIAVTASGRPVFSVAQEGDLAIVAETGREGQIYYAITDDGDLKWKVYIPGYTVQYSVDSRGNILAVAYRPVKTEAGTIKVIISIFNRGEKVGSWSVMLPSAVQMANLKISNPSNDRIAVYDPATNRIEVYSFNGELLAGVEEKRTIRALWLSPSGDLIAYTTTSSSGCNLTFYSIIYNRVWSVKADDCILGVDSKISVAAVYSGNYTIIVYDYRGNKLGSILFQSPQYVIPSEKGNYIMIVGEYTVSLFLVNGEEILSGTTLDRITSASFSPNGKYLTVADASGRVYYYVNPESEKLSMTVKMLLAGVLFLLALLALVKYLRGQEKPALSGEGEEIFPPPEES
jgi:WD40 repeat protein